MNKITTILFDFDRTLRFATKEWEEFAADYLDSIGYPSTPENRWKSRRWTCYYFCSNEFIVDRDSLSEDESFWEIFNRKFIEQLLADSEIAKKLAPELRQTVREDYYSKDWDFIPEGGIETLRYLQTNGYQLGIITNRQKCIADELAKLNLTEFFPNVIVSGLVGSQKPEPEIFHYAVSQMETRHENCLYIGDNYFADVVGARNVGIEPVLIDPAGYFPEADCLRIEKLSELPELLNSFLN